MEVKMHEILEQKMCKELELLEQKYSGKSDELSIQDLEKIDKLYHALKSMATYNAMKEAEEYEEMDGMSGRRGRGADGRYVSRDMGRSYEDGYAHGYSEAMAQNGGTSGHYPMPPYHPVRRY